MYKLYYRLCHEQVITGTRVHLDVCWSVSSDVYQVRNNSGVLNWKAKLTVVEVCDSLNVVLKIIFREPPSPDHQHLYK